MKLMTKTLEKRFAKIGRQEQVEDPIIVAKFFNPTGAGTWYAAEYDPKTRIFFGYVSIFGACTTKSPSKTYRSAICSSKPSTSSTFWTNSPGGPSSWTSRLSRAAMGT